MNRITDALWGIFGMLVALVGGGLFVWVVFVFVPEAGR